VIGVVFLDVPVGGRAYPSLLPFGKLVDRKLASNLILYIILGEPGCLDLVLILILGNRSVLFSLLNFLVDLAVVGSSFLLGLLNRASSGSVCRGR
jgi:hypothetical protein